MLVDVWVINIGMELTSSPGNERSCLTANDLTQPLFVLSTSIHQMAHFILQGSMAGHAGVAPVSPTVVTHVAHATPASPTTVTHVAHAGLRPGGQLAQGKCMGSAHHKCMAWK